VGGTCGSHGRGKESVQRFGGKPEGKNHSEDQGVDGRMGSDWILGTLAGGVDWIQLVQDRDRWQALVNTVMNLRALTPRS
jgi:hypothetical protein